ncbi:MAG: hypothetical protein NC390_02685 [Fusobacterium sp.]|nr:hypothetical protein [Fusobacterium sp.]
MTNNKQNNIIKEIEEWYSGKMVADTLKYQQQYEFDAGKNNKTTWNNEADAFKHTYMQAFMSLLGGPLVGKMAGDMHESQGTSKGQPTGESNMDLWNNREGREIAAEIINEYGIVYPFDSKVKDIIAQKVMERMKAGKLITNPNDKRKFQETGYAAPVQGIEQIFTPEEIAQMSNEEFTKNETAIMEQLQNGQIKKDKPDYSKFTNPLSGRKKVYTKEEVNKMSPEEFTGNEKEIMAQANSIGLPEHKDVYKQSSSAAASNGGKWVTINGNHVLIDK